MTRTLRIELVTTGLCVLAGATFIGARGAETTRYCTQTANTMFLACKASMKDDGFVGNANCLNITSSSTRTSCLDELADSQAEASALCEDQHDARLAVCGVLGERRYDPDFSPARFDDPKHPSKPNPYFPLGVGKHWEYRTDTEVDTVDVVNETKRIAGVTCIVLRDVVREDGKVHEATDDWYGANTDGSVWYFGEEAKSYDVFTGDKPKRPELVSIDGSFKAGRDGAKPGIIALASPHVGDAYLEEFSLGEAEDVTEILSTNYSYGHDSELDDNVPEGLVDRFCDRDCVVTKNYSPLEPDVFERKYYARGIGTILEVESTGEVLQLTGCNFDDRCENLPD